MKTIQEIDAAINYTGANVVINRVIVRVYDLIAAWKSRDYNIYGEANKLRHLQEFEKAIRLLQQAHDILNRFGD